MQEEEERIEEIASGLKQEIAEAFQKYTSKYANTYQTDRLNERYVLFPKQPLPQYNTQLTQACVAIDETNSERPLYAAICPLHISPRYKVIQKLKANPHPNLVTLVADGVVRISSLGEERYVIIFEQPKGKPLSEIIAGQAQPFSDRYLIEKIIAPLGSVLAHFEDQGITHGRINPNNVYVGVTLTLGECVSEPCGYSQDFHYEPFNRIQASQSGKGNGHISQDYYALGVLTALMKLRPKPLQDPDQERFVRRLTREGSFLGIIGYADLTDEMADFLRGTFNDNAQDRWTYRQIRPWTTGKRFNLLMPTIPSLGARPFELSDGEYKNLRQLSHAIHHQWETTIPYLRDGSLIKWVEQSTRKREISEYLTRVVKGYNSRIAKSLHETITRFLFALDNQAPIRMKNLAAFPDGISTVYAEYYHRHDDGVLNQLADLIEQNIVSSWSEAQRRIFSVDNLPEEMQQIVTSLEKTRLLIQNSALGFGAERVLYELNPNLPCQSPIVKGYYAADLKHLLIALDQIANSKNRPDFPIDRHIAGFIAAKTNINRDMSFHEFAANPKLAKNLGLIALKFLTQAQMPVQGNFPGITGWCVSSFLDAVGTLHSATIRSQICDGLRSYVYAGQFAPILDYLASYDYTNADASGFEKAAEQYAAFSAKIHDLRSTKLREYKAYILGSTIAKFVAYGVLLFVSLYFYYRE